MSYYKRNIGLKLILARCLLLGCVALLINLFKSGLNDYAVILIVVLFICAFVPITSLVINDQNFTVRKYYMFGLLPLAWTFQKKDNIKVRPFEVLLEPDEDAVLVDADSILGFSTPFLLGAKYRSERFAIHYVDKKGSPKKLRLLLSEREQSLIKELFITHQSG